MTQYIESMRYDGEYRDRCLFGAIYALYGVRIRIRMSERVVFEDVLSQNPAIEL